MLTRAYRAHVHCAGVALNQRSLVVVDGFLLRATTMITGEIELPIFGSGIQRVTIAPCDQREKEYAQIS